MARNPLTIQTRHTNAQELTEESATGSGSGNGVTYAHSKAAPVACLVRNGSAGSIELTVVAKVPALVTGVQVPDQVIPVAQNASVLVWVPPDYFASAGLVAVDVTSGTQVGVAFSALRDTTTYSHFV